jgi:hypothetical protein
VGDARETGISSAELAVEVAAVEVGVGMVLCRGRGFTGRVSGTSESGRQPLLAPVAVSAVVEAVLVFADDSTADPMPTLMADERRGRTGGGEETSAAPGRDAVLLSSWGVCALRRGGRGGGTAVVVVGVVMAVVVVVVGVRACGQGSGRAGEESSEAVMNAGVLCESGERREALGGCTRAKRVGVGDGVSVRRR